MDDDLDDLLDEVESKFCQDVSIRPPAHTDPVKFVKCDNESEGKKTHRSDTEDIDALLEDLLDEDYDSSHPKTGQLSKRPETGKKPLPQIGGKKCCPVFLGGSSVTNGIGTAISKRSCDQLRCTSCDFRVLLFDDYAWDASCDYLFLRNNMPDSQKLRAKLKRKRGTRAYACQCSWFSSEDLADLRDQTQLKWVCAAHMIPE